MQPAAYHSQQPWPTSQLMDDAAAHGVPLRTVVPPVAPLAAACLLGILAYRLRAYLLLFLAAGQYVGVLAAVPAVLGAAVHSLTAGIVTLIVFAVYIQAENHFLNPMSRTVRPNPPLGLVSVLVAGAIGNWLGGTFGTVGFLLAIRAAVSLHIAVREIWRATSAEQAVRAEPQGDASPGFS